jgi:amidohydrolase
MIAISSCENRYGELLKSIKSDLHMHPELSMEEYRTTKIVCNYLSSLGIEVMDLGLETGVIGVLHGKNKGPIVGLRADIDALPITESPNDTNISKEDGKMHACGHDVHSASLIGAAMLLCELREKMKGSVVFVFQPAEETVLGAKLLIKAGLFERIKIDAMFGLHVRPDIDIGRIGIKAGPVMSAKDSFSITILGKGGHGSAPQKTADPIVAGAALITTIQSIISRNIDPMEAAVISVCTLHAGTADNIIPDKLVMQGSIRSFSESIRDLMMHRLADITLDVSKAYGCVAELKMIPGTPMLVNDPKLMELATKSAIQVLGKACLVEQERDMCSDDFAEYANLIPAFFYFVGVGSQERQFYPLHNPRFSADERAPVIGATLLANAAWNTQQS